MVSGSFVDDCLSVSLASEVTSGQLRGVIVRKFLLTSSLDRTTREVTHYQYLTWPQHGMILVTLILYIYIHVHTCIYALSMAVSCIWSNLTWDSICCVSANFGDH